MRLSTMINRTLPGLLCLILLAGTPVEAEENTAQVHLTGRTLEINGKSEIPIGMFGVHATPMDEARAEAWGVESVRHIVYQPDGKPILPGAIKQIPENIPHIVECFYDRYRPALMLTDPKNWESRLIELGRSYAENAKTTGHPQHIVEFWNEPYLNWAARPGVNYDGRFYEGERVEGGGTVIPKWTGKRDERLIWAKQTVAVRPGADIDYVASRYMPADKKHGEKWTWRNREFEIQERWWVRDKTQKHWWSGLYNRDLYIRMLVPFARSIKETNPDVQVIAGWGFWIQSNGWDGFRMLYQPTIDEAIQWIDGIHEHHYGGDTRMVAGTYEVTWAYAKAKYGKSLDFYNTEAGGSLDPEQPGGPKPAPAGSPRERALGAMTYTLRDIIHLLEVSPDKAVARAAHEAHNNGGDEFAFRLLKPLRGQLIEVTSSDPHVWTVASWQKDRMAVVMFNDTRQPRTVRVNLDPVRSTQLVSAEVLDVSVDGEKLKLNRTPTKLQSTNGQTFIDLTLPPKSAKTVVVSLQLPRGRVNPEQIVMTQHPADDILAWVSPGESVNWSLDLPADRFAKADSARLKLVTMAWNNGATLKINGNVVPVNPPAQWVHEQPLAKSLLKPGKNSIEISNRGNRHFGLSMASVVLVELNR